MRRLQDPGEPAGESTGRSGSAREGLKTSDVPAGTKSKDEYWYKLQAVATNLWPTTCRVDVVRTIRLLIVEDSPSYLFLLQSAFDKHQGKFRWEITIATDGAEALRLLFAEEKDSAVLPDLVLLDWNLPKVNGGEVLRRVKEHQKLRRIPILVFSASDADKDIRDAYDNHANGYIIKPDSLELMEAIVETIGRFWVEIAQLSTPLR